MKHATEDEDDQTDEEGFGQKSWSLCHCCLQMSTHRESLQRALLCTTSCSQQALESKHSHIWRVARSIIIKTRYFHFTHPSILYLLLVCFVRWGWWSQCKVKLCSTRTREQSTTKINAQTHIIQQECARKTAVQSVLHEPQRFVGDVSQL